MYLDLNEVFDDLVDFAFYHKSEVENVMEDRVKCEDGTIIDFYDDVESSVSRFTDIVVLRRKQTGEHVILWQENEE